MNHEIGIPKFADVTHRYDSEKNVASSFLIFKVKFLIYEMK